MNLKLHVENYRQHNTMKALSKTMAK